MKPVHALELWNDAAFRQKGMDHDGNTAHQLTGFGGFILARGLQYLSKWHAQHEPDSIRKAAALLREWADALESSLPKDGPTGLTKHGPQD